MAEETKVKLAYVGRKEKFKCKVGKTTYDFSKGSCEVTAKQAVNLLAIAPRSFKVME